MLKLNKKQLMCPVCNDEVYSGVGEGCKMCGMILKDKDKDFCCKLCMRKHNTINKHSGGKKWIKK